MTLSEEEGRLPCEPWRKIQLLPREKQGGATNAGRLGPPPPRMDLPSPWVLALSPFPFGHGQRKTNSG